MTIETIALVVALICIVLVSGLTLYVLRSRNPAGDAGNEVILKLDEFSTRLASEHGAVSAKFDQLDRKLAHVETTVDQREGAIQEHMGSIGSQVAGIVSLFSNDRTRGSWGELSLERIFEVAGLVEGRDYVNQFGEGEGRPDVVIFLPGDQRIVVDSKFPIARYQEAMAEEDPAEREVLLKAHGKELERVGKSLVGKHYADNASAGYVIVFLPSQAVYEAAAAAHPDVTERLMQLGIIVAGPVNVFALIKTAGTLMAEHRAVGDARQIISHVRDLRSRLGVFAGHLTKVGSGLKSASAAYNGAIGSWNTRLGPSVNRIAEMSGADQLSYLEEVQASVVGNPDDLSQAV